MSTAADDTGVVYDSDNAHDDKGDDNAVSRRRVAQRVFDLLTAEVADGDVLHWDRASPYLLRHAAEHAADAGGLDRLLHDWEFLVHGDPRSILATSPAGRRDHTSLTVYRTSLARHATAPAEQRRHILAVDAVRHQRPDISRSLYEPSDEQNPPWQCAWSTGANISPALRASLTGHSRPLGHLALAVVDGEPLAVTAGADETVRVFHADTGTLRHAWKGHTGGVTALTSHTRDGRTLVVTADTRGRLRVWDARTGRASSAVDAHDGPVTGLETLLHDGRLCSVSVGHDGTLRVTDFERGRSRVLLTTASGYPRGLLAVAWNRSEPLVLTAVAATGEAPAQVVAVALRDGRALYSMPLAAEVTGLECGGSYRDPIAVATLVDGTGRIWDAVTGRSPHAFNRRGRPGDLDVLHLPSEDDADPMPRAATAVTGGADGTVRIWDLDTGERLNQLEGHHQAVLALSSVYAPHPTQDGVDPELDERHTDRSALRQHALSVSQRRGNRLTLARLIVLSASADDTVRSWSVENGRELHTYTGHTAPVRRVAAFAPLSHSGRWMAVSCGDDATGRVWDLSDRTEHIAGAVHPGRIEALASDTPRGRPLVVTACGDHRLRILDNRTGSLLSARMAGDSPVRAVALGSTREGSVSASVSSGRGIVVRLVDTGSVLWNRRTDVPVVALVAGGSSRRPVLVTLDGQGHTHMWELGSGRLRSGPLNRYEGVSALALGRIRDTPVALTGRSDGEVVLWNLASGSVRRVLSPAGKSPGVTAVRFTAGPSGPRVASQHLWADHHSVRVTDAETGRLLSAVRLDAPAEGEAIPVFGLGSTPDSAVVAVGGPDNEVRLWDADSGQGVTGLWLPDAVQELSFSDHVLTVSYGRELAAFVPAAHPALSAEEEDPRLAVQRRTATVPVRRRPNRSVLQVTVLGLLEEWEGHHGPSLVSHFCRHVPGRAVKSAIRALIQEGLIRRIPTAPLGYAVEPRGRALVRAERPAGDRPAPSSPPPRLRDIHGRPCGHCLHRRFRLQAGGPGPVSRIRPQ
ncbi:WD40 repeat domain-containing protein [Streptomyces sp. NPDC004311]|uniref:WD40 repeat domain-containing protein n=1 Tax=Streptomyces sp. NPDC004311 TaxID=3364698 RepID=UPI003687A123